MRDKTMHATKQRVGFGGTLTDQSGNNGRLSSEALLMLAALLNLYKLDLLSDEGLRELIATGLTSRNDNALI